MKRKIFTIAAIVLAVALIMTIGTRVIGRKPFKDLKADEIRSVTIHLWPPNESMELTDAEIEELVGLLQQVEIHHPTWMHHASGDQSNVMAITFQDGSVKEVNQFGSILIIDGMGYRAEYEANEAINQFSNKLFNTGF